MNHLDNLPTDIEGIIKYYMIVGDKSDYFLNCQDRIIGYFSELTIFDVAYLDIVNKSNKINLKELCKSVKIKPSPRGEYFTRINLMEVRLNQEIDYVLPRQKWCMYFLQSGKGEKKIKE